jgi:DNA modification methylase
MKLEPDKFNIEVTSLWSFPERGVWATHNSKYRGNYAPQVPRNIILNYTKKGETVLDPMVGSGTTMIECKLLHRDGISFDINNKAIELTKKALQFDFETESHQIVFRGDVRDLGFIGSETIDLICTHPPYLNMITYSKGKIKEDLSNISDPQKFCDELGIGIKEMFRVLKPDHYCAILIGDTRRNQHYIPLSYFVLRKFLQNGFILKEEIIKAQHNCTYSSEWTSSAKKYKFFLIMHEHLFVFRKPRKNEVLSKYRWSHIPNGMQNIID